MRKEQHPVVFSQEVLSFLKKISVISPPMIFKKEGNKTVLRCKSPVVGVSFETPSANFDFHTEDLAFANFKDFCENLEYFKSDIVEMTQDDRGVIQIKGGKFSLHYRTSNTAILKKSTFNVIKDTSEIEVDFKISKADFTMLSRQCSRIKPEEVKVSISDGKANFVLLNNRTNIQFDFAIDVETDVTKTFVLPTQVLTDIPLDHDYEASLSKNGRFDLKTTAPNYEVTFHCGLKVRHKDREVVEFREVEVNV